MTQPAPPLRRPPFLAAAGALTLALATILGAWGFQLIGGYVPCKLCLEERIPYYFGIPLALLALAASGTGRGRLARLILLALAALFLYGAWLGLYHAGAEWAWWPGPTDCGGGIAPSGSVEDLAKQMQGIRVVSCTQASWRLFGLSFAGWNAFISALLALGALWGALRHRPKAPGPA